MEKLKTFIYRHNCALAASFGSIAMMFNYSKVLVRAVPPTEMKNHSELSQTHTHTHTHIYIYIYIYITIFITFFGKIDSS